MAVTERLAGNDAIKEHVCFAFSDEGFICNLPPKHDGPHRAEALDLFTDESEKRVVCEWED